MSVNRRELVRWMAVGPVAWAVVPACSTPKEPSVASDAECCDDTASDIPSDDTSAADETGDSGDSGGADDSGEMDDSGLGCDTADDVACTVEPDVEGPFYTPDAPEKSDLKEEDGGTPICIEGRIVHAEDCEAPLSGAVFDAWHASDAGDYDNTGYRYRGKVTCDADGRFVLKTVLPGSYPDRPVRHIHFKIWDAEGNERITSQLYFDGDDSYNPAVHVGPLLSLDGDGVAEVVLGI